MMPDLFNDAFCEGNPTWFGLFDFSYAPSLLLYAYFPIVIVSLLMGIYIFFKRKGFVLPSITFFLLTILFGSYILNETLQWITVPAKYNLFAWQMIALLHSLMMFILVYFVYTFLYQKDLTFKYKLILTAPLIPVILFLPTSLNMEGFDLVNCEAVPGLFSYYIYFLEIFTSFALIFICLRNFHLSAKNRDKKFSLLTLAGSLSFIFFLFFTFIIGDFTGEFEYLLIGPIGMVIFLGTLTYLMVRFNAFNIKLIATQALIIIIAIMVGAQLFFVKSTTNKFLTGATLIFTIAAGYQLIKSVKREINQREEIQRLAKKLEKANVRLTQIDKLKSEFVSIASHQLRSPITAISGYASLMRQGSYGEISAKMKVPVERIEQSARMMAESIDDYLNVSRIESGNMKYNNCDMNLIDEAEHICDDLRSEALKLGLILLFKKKTDSRGIIHADHGKVQQIIHNLLNNSIKYTPKGVITVYVHDDLKTKKIFVDIVDTGIGMSIETINTIFQKFERGDSASAVNVKGTGLGLYVALKMAEAMDGNITAHSEGEGKGSRFTIEMPLVM